MKGFFDADLECCSSTKKDFDKQVKPVAYSFQTVSPPDEENNRELV